MGTFENWERFVKNTLDRLADTSLTAHTTHQNDHIRAEDENSIKASLKKEKRSVSNRRVEHE